MRFPRLPLPTWADVTVAGFTGALLLVSTCQWKLGRDQLEVTRAALADAEAPHVRLWFDGKFDKNGKLFVVGHAKNAGSLTIFNAKVWTVFAFSPRGEDKKVWDGLKVVDEAVLGPEDVEDYLLPPATPLPNEAAMIRDQTGFFVSGIKMEFTDKADRHHERYDCSLWFINSGHVDHRECDTPPQS